MEFLFGTKSQLIFRIVFIPFVLLGTLVRVGLAFNLSNIFMLVMVVPNLIALVASMNVVNALKENYFSGAKYVSYWDSLQGEEDVIAEAVAKQKKASTVAEKA
jgi:Na+/alanine symporter